MVTKSRHNTHDKYRSRIDSLLKTYLDEASESSPESQSHSAKYLAVLVSGYLEQAVKELLLDYASSGSRQQIWRYIEKSWPSSKNMSTENIKEILNQFNEKWSENFLCWLDEQENRKADINSIVSWRNRIAHGQESNTNGVSLVTVKEKFITVQSFINFLEQVLDENGLEVLT